MHCQRCALEFRLAFRPTSRGVHSGCECDDVRRGQPIAQVCTRAPGQGSTPARTHSRGFVHQHSAGRRQDKDEGVWGGGWPIEFRPAHQFTHNSSSCKRACESQRLAPNAAWACGVVSRRRDSRGMGVGVGVVGRPTYLQPGFGREPTRDGMMKQCRHGDNDRAGAATVRWTVGFL